MHAAGCGYNETYLKMCYYSYNLQNFIQELKGEDRSGDLEGVFVTML